MRRRTHSLVGLTIVLSGCLTLAGAVDSRNAQAAVSSLGGKDSMADAKALYATGHYMEALNGFTSVLRSDPQNKEAKEYLRLIVEQMKKPSERGAAAVTSTSRIPDDVKRRLSKRFLLTQDLNAIPGIHVTTQSNGASVEIPSAMLFDDKSAGLKDEGVPVLDRVSAWLRTFERPIMIHCYPEETAEPSKEGNLFLQRYSELYSFFVQERKLDPARFVSAEDLHVEGKRRSDEQKGVDLKSHRVVIEVIGLDFPFSDGSAPPASGWLEHSLKAEPAAINPEEGESSVIDVAALSQANVTQWSLVITPDTSPERIVYKVSGSGNVLRRVRWDGRDDNGSFVRPGMYSVVWSASNGRGGRLAKDGHVMVHRGDATSAAAEPAPVATAKKKKAAPKKKAKPAVETPKVAPPVADESLSGVESMPATHDAAAPETKQETKPVSAESSSTADATSDTAAAPEPDSSESADGSQAIWKQIIQFDPNESQLKPSLKSSLERISKTLEVYPLQKVRIIGFAMPSEKGGVSLARKRADVVRSILVDEFHVDRKRVIVGGGRTSSASGASKVEMSITN